MPGGIFPRNGWRGSSVFRSGENQSDKFICHVGSRSGNIKVALKCLDKIEHRKFAVHYKLAAHHAAMGGDKTLLG